MRISERSVSKLVLVSIAVAMLALASSARGAVSLDAIITADNHYALYTGNASGSVVNFVGRNEVGLLGSEGGLNWNDAETYNVASMTDTHIYIAAWSDDLYAQGLLGEFHINGIQLLTGDDGWQVYMTREDRDTGDPHPTEVELSAQIATATAAGEWEEPFAGGNNGSAPWGMVDGITPDALWTWIYGGPINWPPSAHWLWRGGFVGYNPCEYLIFRRDVSDIPEPATIALLAFGALPLLRRRKNA